MSKVMLVRLWCADELLGEADLSRVAGVRLRNSALSGAFLPCAAFTHVWPIFDAWNQAAIPLVTAAQRTAAGTPQQFQDALHAKLTPPAVVEFERAATGVSGVAFELRDRAGGVVPHESVQIGEWNLFATLTNQAERGQAELALAGEGIATRGYVLVVTGVTHEDDDA